MRFSLLLIPLFIFSSASFAENKQADSLRSLLATEQNPAKKIELYHALGMIYREIDWQKTFEYGFKTIALSDSVNNARGQALGQLNTGMAYFYRGDLPKAIKNFQKSLLFGEKFKDTAIISESLYGLYYVFSEIGDYGKSMELIQKRMNISMLQKNVNEMISNLNNKGYIFSKTKQTDSAFYYYNAGIKLALSAHNRSRLATLYSNLGNLYTNDLSRYDSALKYQHKALKIRTKIHEYYTIAYSMILIGRTYSLAGKYDKAEDYFFNGLSAAKKYYSYANLKMAYDNLYKMYKRKGDLKRAMLYSELNQKIADSLHTADTHYMAANLKIEMDVDQLEKELSLQKEELKNKDTIINYFVLGASLVTIFSMALYYNYNEKQKINKLLILKNTELRASNEEIETQKNLLEEQNEEIRSQAKELMYVNNEITLINANLETLVAQRTEKLKEQNGVILDYAFMNSHKLRAPIVRILGLFQLIDMEKDPAIRQEYYTYLKKSVEDLDHITKDITSKLTKDSDRG